MAQYHVGCSPITGTIYAGTLNKKGDMWLNKSDVTEEAQRSVCESLYMKAISEKKDQFGYEWDKPDGSKVQLFVKIIQANEGG